MSRRTREYSIAYPAMYAYWKVASGYNKCGNCLLVGSTILCLLIMAPATETVNGAFDDSSKVEQVTYEVVDSNLHWALGIERTPSKAANGRFATAVQCYSCMSRTMGSLWEIVGLDRIFMQQQSFTDHCYKPDEHRPPSFVRHCSFTCISMVIEVQFGMGTKAQVRGCYDSIFRAGFNESSPAVSILKRKDFCHKFNLSEITRHRPRFDSLVEVCSCRGQLCNGGRMPVSGAYAHTGLVRSIIAISIALSLGHYLLL